MGPGWTRPPRAAAWGAASQGPNGMRGSGLIPGDWGERRRLICGETDRLWATGVFAVRRRALGWNSYRASISPTFAIPAAAAASWALITSP
jgi:hypothetical protein